MLYRTDKHMFLDGIGTITLRQSVKARYIRIRVSAEEGVVLIVPRNTPEVFALKFVELKRQWIKNSLNKRQDLQNNKIVFDETTQFSTRQRKLSIGTHDKTTVKSMVTATTIFIWYPAPAPVNDDRIQKIIHRAIIAAWRLEAHQYLPLRVNELAKKFNFKYTRLNIKNAKTRWGSCSSSNSLNLNLQLMSLPDKLIDYVILHELAHTVEKNHQLPFWRLMENILPGARDLDKELNKFHLFNW